jgi:phosphoglycolate phosphatase-like HAD superfamily hydrolase
MIGDTPADYLAARGAGVPFLGYARDEATAGRLRAAGATVIVDSLETVLKTLRR